MRYGAESAERNVMQILNKVLFTLCKHNYLSCSLQFVDFADHKRKRFKSVF